MHKYIAIYKDGTVIPYWAIDRNLAAFHAKDGVRLHGAVVKIMTAKQYQQQKQKQQAVKAA